MLSYAGCMPHCLPTVAVNCFDTPPPVGSLRPRSVNLRLLGFKLFNQGFGPRVPERRDRSWAIVIHMDTMTFLIWMKRPTRAAPLLIYCFSIMYCGIGELWQPSCGGHWQPRSDRIFNLVHRCSTNNLKRSSMENEGRSSYNLNTMSAWGLTLLILLLSCLDSISSNKTRIFSRLLSILIF
jgi:hypothetical protein